MRPEVEKEVEKEMGALGGREREGAEAATDDAEEAAEEDEEADHDPGTEDCFRGD